MRIAGPLPGALTYIKHYLRSWRSRGRQSLPDKGREAAGTLMNTNLGMAVLVSIVHATAMIAAGGCFAWLVYRYLGLKFVSRSWFNLDTSWAVGLILVGAIALVFGLTN